MSSRREGSAQPPLFAVRGQIGRRQYWALALIGLVVPLLLWWAVSASGMVTKTFMPGPVHVWDRAVLWFTEDDLMPGVISIPHGYGHGRKGVKLSVAQERPGVSVNDLTNPALKDKLSGNAVLNGVPVQIERA